ncbi:type I DNA topoisomerase [Blochmannia endosymbiont of Polyrhachis (Hedomyrma) turneri]|uniref:type I DNA topoisomerase n=1 Tax=Blochmannia endosymbiont of Polyrhachis (Hedomyrma) turneri TaxID=1505596 RepID=UPI00061A745C|nr:type I DNA topoisomerase [Blochmannia endosymbiont of Polyrhachis (Hedomyrma) turneri]AKC59986.1 DNA topoisomerase 1 [Blochmannia endosymbiont of Polyrhachis (Hedomyrma) turneri]
MRKFLVIVESPAKAKTINKYLGNNYIVKSSFGHVRDLPSNSLFIKNQKDHRILKKNVDKLDKKNALIHRIGIDPYHGWIAKYEILPGKEKIIDELSMLAKNSDHVYLATDLDREGEAIAWHLQEVIQVDRKKISRVIFNEITCDAIMHSFKHPTVLNIGKVHAQQARRFMDRLVGYMLSPLLWKKIARGLSAGRVQSVAVRLVVERERRIRNFISKEYWKLYIDLIGSIGNELRFQVVRNGKSRFIPTTETELKQAKNILLQTDSYVISNRVDKFLFVRAHPPFVTSTLQQSASVHLGYSIKKTMLLAQRLYEAGYITYMRTDSTNVSKSALSMVRSYIYDVFGQEYLSKKNNEYNFTSCVQGAHEAIRPSNVCFSSESIKDKNSDLKKLYHLIRCQFIASQMSSSKDIITTLSMKIGDFTLQFSHRICFFDGWKKIMSKIGNQSDQKEKNKFPDFKIGEVLKFKRIVATQHFTKAPVRYNEASLVKELEKRGIGRPSTYVSIISTIQDRGYVCLYHAHFYAMKIGEIVTDRLSENFYELMDYQFTANMEGVLDKIADNQTEWKIVLDDFFIRFSEQLSVAEKDFEDGGMRQNSMIMTSIVCSLCGKNMGIRVAVTGVFLSCEGYKNIVSLKSRCKNTINLVPEMLQNSIPRSNHFKCEKCNSVMDSYFIDSCRKLHVCVNNPLCAGYNIENGEFGIQKISDFCVVQCDKCMYDMYVKFGRFGKYMLCSNLDCKNTMKISSNDCVVPKKSLVLPLPELICEKSNAYFVLRDGKAGIFLAANTFPKSRETRAPFVEELVRFRDRLPKKLSYLADAPIYDIYGNKTLVRFDRKSKQQYVVSMKDGKCTSWKSFFINGCWKIKSDK